ncbi:MAG TPA: hypothetical protein VGX00_01425 [Thermoplasmata archaeon]|nr:hypothetical protein [Thermoplasmata archaeon]
MDRIVFLVLIAIVGILLLLPGPASAEAPVSTGKVVAPGAFGVPYGQGNYPAIQSTFRDADLVYDSQISIEVVNANPGPVAIAIETEEWTAGTRTIYVNVTGPNNSSSIRPEVIPARIDPSWSNVTLTVLADSSSEISLPLAFASTQRPLEVLVGSATWELQLLSPVTSSLQGVYTTGGLELVALTEAAVTTGVIVAFLVAARRLASSVLRTPRVHPLWPALWVTVPVALTVFEYVPTNQFFGALSVWIYPVVIGVAAFPYLPRLWRHYEVSEFEGVSAVNLEQATNSKNIVCTTTARGGLRCVPETWRELFWILWGRPLPPVRGTSATLFGKKVDVPPRGMVVSSPMGAFYKAEPTTTYWYDARAPLTRTRTHLEWFSTSSEGKRRLSPHVVDGYLQGQFPPKPPVARELAGIRDAETEAHDNEVDRLMIAELTGALRHEQREYAIRSLATYDEAAQRLSQPRSRDEIRRLIERQRNTPHGTKPQAPAETED